MATRLTEFNLGSDKHTFLSKLIKSIFSTYLESYIDMEREYLRNRGAMILQRYYDSKNHQKRPIGPGRSAFGSHFLFTSCEIIGSYYLQISFIHTQPPSASFYSIQELKERIRQRTNLPLGPSIDTHGETFLSPELVVNLLQETRHAFERCHKVRIL